ncbi:MAG: hypothetical protein ACT4PY_08360 [Armatimonadota bacterium]
MRGLRTVVALLVVVIIGVALTLVNSPQASSQGASGQRNLVLERQAQVAMGGAAPAGKRQAVSEGVMRTYLEATGRLPARSSGYVGGLSLPSSVSQRSLGCANVFEGDGARNIRVNQDCSLRRQAEEFIAINPTNPDNLVAGQNDSLIGFNHCGIDFSFDRGETWGSFTPPFWQQLMGARPGNAGRTTDAASDPAVTFDSRGNAYFTCIIFNATNAPENGIVVAKSNARHGGSFFHSPRPDPFQEFRASPLGVVADDFSPFIFNDKEFINADRNPGSPKRDFVYVTWTRFNDATGAGVRQNSPIFFSQSRDGGATWSRGIEISGRNSAICTIFSGSPNPDACDQDQGSWPEVGPDGTVYVVFANGNTPLFGINQTLVVSCAPTADCTNAANWSKPVKVADLIGLHPIGPDPATGCAAFRQCLPPNGYRVPEVTSMTLLADPSDSNRLYVTWADSRNHAANCRVPVPATAATPPCNHDVFLAVSTNRGATWSAPILVSVEPKKAAQWQPWSAIMPNGKIAIAYYDRQYGSCEFTGCNDITLAFTRDSGGSFEYHRITTASMPNLIPANNPVQAGFLGDYMGIAADRRGVVIVWGDTRGRLGTVEEDIYFARFP